MVDSSRLTFLGEKTEQNLSELWENCFQGEENLSHINQYVPYRVQSQNQLDPFLMRYDTWFIKRKMEGDIIGFLIHGNFIPGLPNNIGFNIGLKYTSHGYATESLRSLLLHLKSEGMRETCGHCFQTNLPSIRVMESCGFINEGRVNGDHGASPTIRFRKII